MDKRRKESKIPENEMVKILETVASTNAGVKLLRHILGQSGFLSAGIMSSQEMINTDALIMWEARREMYLGLRQYMTREVLTKVEINWIREVDSDVETTPTV